MDFSLCFLLLHLLQLSSLSLLSSAYTLPDQYFINCGSASNAKVGGRNFTGDVNPSSFALSADQSNLVTDTNSSTDTSLYHTARIFQRKSSYNLDIVQKGTYMVRFHFFPFSSQKNLSDAQFNVSASGFSLLSNFKVQKTNSTSPVIEEFLVTIEVGKFKIDFTPQQSSFAFVNAIEVFLTPEGFIPDSAPPVTVLGTSYNGLLSHALHLVYRINVGGPKITPEMDTLLRNWVPDDEFLHIRDAAKNSQFHNSRPMYQPQGSTEYIAPDLVYQTAKEMNISGDRAYNVFNITWRFNVSKNLQHLVRVHFCDIISPSLGASKFNLFMNGLFGREIYPYHEISQLAAPFYHDFVVDSGDSGHMNVSVGPKPGWDIQNAFLNGLEIMELIGGSENKSPKKHVNVIVVVGSAIGGAALVSILIAVFLFRFRFRKTKPDENKDWQAIPFYGGGSFYSGTTERTVNDSPVCNLNLGLKLPFSEIQYATKNFDGKLMIGEGGFGKVYKGTLRNGIKVAVKRSEPGHGQGLPEFQTEIMVLTKIRHRHLVSLIGYCDERSEMILVYEFMEKGTLRDHLYKSNEDSQKSSSRSELSWNQRLDICIGAAKGLHYLHTSSDRGIIHRDVKSTNILLDEHFVAKVADFGLSRLGAVDQTHVSTDVKGSFGYLDPEYFRCLQLTQKSDVYSFGVVLLELLCARPAIDPTLPREQVNLAEWGLSWHKKGELEKIADPFLASKINPNSLRMFGETVEKCLREYGVERPNMHDVLWDLEYALQLQQTARHREPHEDSTTDASWVLPVPVVQRLPSQSFPISEEMPTADFSDTSHTNAREVFSQLRMDDAR